jgi:hypothetical protein
LFSLPRFFDESRELPPSLIDARLCDREQEHSGRTIISRCKRHVHSEPPLATTQATTHLVGGGGEMVTHRRQWGWFAIIDFEGGRRRRGAYEREMRGQGVSEWVTAD